ncbi:hypothetical protein ONZ43_g1848 [Nemania bipapillata]|uniref:Uncharacterized protein n=1 Tax=Nemania bipapillata TaxID=110536 RepID=A0ACC2J2T9_9PEZI|nr:hypothetical protein ONZ43_g1848 [Nemania bipapillata]
MKSLPDPSTPAYDDMKPDSLEERASSIPSYLGDQFYTSHLKTTARVNKKRVSTTKGHLSRRTAHVRDVVREVAGHAPYERRIVELLRNSKDKRARKLAKKRLGSFQRGKKKVDELQRVIAESRRVAH